MLHTSLATQQFQSGVPANMLPCKQGREQAQRALVFALQPTSLSC